MENPVTQLIVQMVSPAVMISGCGLMLLTLGNKYARVVDRIRDFTAEARELHQRGNSRSPSETKRMQKLDLQIPDLFRRGRMLRNAVLCFYTAVGSFVACSFAIALEKFGYSTWGPMILFCLGMGNVLAAIIIAWRETLLSFRLINLELPEAN